MITTTLYPLSVQSVFMFGIVTQLQILALDLLNCILFSWVYISSLLDGISSFSYVDIQLGATSKLVNGTLSPTVNVFSVSDQNVN